MIKLDRDRLTSEQQALLASGACIVKESPFREYIARSSDGKSMSKYLRELCARMLASDPAVSASDVYTESVDTCRGDWGITPVLRSIEAYLAEAKGEKPTQPYHNGGGKRKRKAMRKATLSSTAARHARNKAATQTAATKRKRKSTPQVPALQGTAPLGMRATPTTQSQFDALTAEAKSDAPVTIPDTPEADAYDESLPVGARFHPRLYKLMVALVRDGRNVSIEGPAGCGKTILALAVCAAVDAERNVTGAPLRENFYKGKEVEDLQGAQGVRVKDGGMETYSKYAATRDACENGRPVVWDEHNVVTGDVLYGGYPILEGAGSTFVAPDGAVVTVQDGAAVIATTNDMHGDKEQYAGLQESNEAYKDRFVAFFTVDYMPEAREVAWLHKETGIPTDKARKLVKLANFLRKTAKQGDFDGDMSHRKTRNVCRMIVDYGVSMRDAVQYGIVNAVSEHSRQVVIDAAQREGVR